MELNVQNLSVARGGIAVLEGLSFCVNRGEALILRGPNGIGKTTLLRTLAVMHQKKASLIAHTLTGLSRF